MCCQFLFLHVWMCVCIRPLSLTKKNSASSNQASAPDSCHSSCALIIHVCLYIEVLSEMNTASCTFFTSCCALFHRSHLHTRACTRAHTHFLTLSLAFSLALSLARSPSLACSLDWCCFYYFVRNSLAALLEAIWTQMEIWVLIFWSFCRNRTDNLETNSPALWPTKLVSHRLSALTNYSSLSWLHHRSLCRGAASMFCGEEQRKCQNWV